MHRVVQGNLEEMAHIFERYHLRIYNFFFQMIRDGAVCEDLTQNVFYRAMKYRHSYNGGKFVSWIFKIARNLFSDHYQKQKGRQSFEDIESIVGSSDEAQVEKEEEVGHLYKVLDLLAADEKELLVMNRLEGIKYEQLAEITESTTGAVKTKVHRIMKKVRHHYFKSI